MELVSDVGVVHLVVVVVAEVPTKEFEVDSLLEGGTPNFLRHRHPGDALTAVRDHVERLLVIAGCTTKSKDRQAPQRMAALTVPRAALAAFPIFSS